MFHVLEGDFTFRVGEETVKHGPGSFLLIPKGTPHTYRIDSAAGGHWVTVTSHGDFEKFVIKMGRAAEKDDLPEPSGPPSKEQADALASIASEYGIELVGPPLH